MIKRICCLLFCVLLLVPLAGCQKEEYTEIDFIADVWSEEYPHLTYYDPNKVIFNLSVQEYVDKLKEKGWKVGSLTPKFGNTEIEFSLEDFGRASLNQYPDVSKMSWVTLYGETQNKRTLQFILDTAQIIDPEITQEKLQQINDEHWPIINKESGKLEESEIANVHDINYDVMRRGDFLMISIYPHFNKNVHNQLEN